MRFSNRLCMHTSKIIHEVAVSTLTSYSKYIDYIALIIVVAI